MNTNAAFFTGDSLSDFNQFLQENNGRWSKIFILVDTNTHQCCLGELIQKISFDQELEILEIDPGENSKDIEIATSLWYSLLELDADRKSLFINLGGGVVSDLGAWVASNYKRGIEFINIPTTVLAMVDAAIGGKTGIDLGGIKNVIGSFSNPVATVIYEPFLDTLPQEEWVSGYAEMIKHALISSDELWSKCKSINPKDHDRLKELISASSKVKLDIVGLDYKEEGLRKSLNFGHTIGHAIEALSLNKGETLSHGNAIGIGMMLANIISMNKSLLSKEDKSEINSYLKEIYQIPSWLKAEKNAIFQHMQKDKKNIGLDVQMVLLKSIGDVLIDIKTQQNEVENAIDQLVKDAS